MDIKFKGISYKVNIRNITLQAILSPDNILIKIIIDELLSTSKNIIIRSISEEVPIIGMNDLYLEYDGSQWVLTLVHEEEIYEKSEIFKLLYDVLDCLIEEGVTYKNSIEDYKEIKAKLEQLEKLDRTHSHQN